MSAGDFNIYSPPRQISPAPDYEGFLRLRRQRAKWMWLAMSPSVIVPLSFFIHPISVLIFLSSLAWVGYCTGRISAINTSLSGNSASALRMVCLYIGLLAMNMVAGVMLLFGACLLITMRH